MMIFSIPLKIFLTFPLNRGKTPLFTAPLTLMPAICVIRPFTFILFGLLINSAAPAQDNFRLNFRYITPQSGLSSIFVRKIVQDPFGYMWVGTEDGLNRFEGRNFTIYNKGVPGKHTLTGEDTRDLLTDTWHHCIWEITSFGGIDAIDYITGNTVYSYRQTNDRSTADIVFNSLALVGDTLYIASTKGLYLLQILTKHLTKAPLQNLRGDDLQLSVDIITRDASNHLWLFCRDRGIFCLKSGTLSILDSLPATQLEPITPGIQFYDCTLLANGNILAGTSAGLRLITLAPNDKLLPSNNPFPTIPLSHGRDIYACRQDRKGNIWFSTAGSLIKTAPSGASCQLVRDHTSREIANWLDAVYNIFFDKEDNVWLGCQAGLAFAANNTSSFTSISRSSLSETTIRHTYCLNPIDDSTLFCCAQEGLYRVDPPKGIVIPLDIGRPYYQAFPDPAGRLLVSSTDGMFILRNGQKIPMGSVYPEFRPLGKQPVNSHCSSGDSLLIFGTRTRGILVWNYQKHTVRIIDRQTPDTWLKDNYVCNVYTDHKGFVWILGYKSVSVLDFGHRTIKSVSTYDPHGNIFYSLLFDVCEARGQYYLASYGSGVLVLDSAYHFVRNLSVRDGLSANSVYKILPYKDSLLFITSNNGLSVVNLHHGYPVSNYYESDGLHSDNFEEYSGAIRNNIVYVGGSNGFTVIDPARFTRSFPPVPVFIRQVKTETHAGIRDTSNLLLSSLDIPDDVLQTNIYFSFINYRNPERSQLSYRIKELDGAWTNMGVQDFVTLVGLNPGKYSLQVRSAGKDGIWSTKLTELTLRFLPKWYQTLWFKILVILTVLALFYAFYLYRIGQLKKQQQIRRDIASDLHDDIGSTLNTVKIFTHLAKRGPEKEDYLTRIEESLTQASIGLRDMIWVLEDSGDTVKELADRIRKFAQPVMQANDIHFECIVSPDISETTISKTVKRNLLLIAKETINNSLKYSGCSNIAISLTQENSRLHLSIRDDGHGFDTSSPPTGNGLRNIQQRTKQIGFSARIISSPQGTITDITG